MKATEFVTPVDEVSMNPTAFAQALEQGHTTGVLVGFEFEVCIPKETYTAPPEPTVDGNTITPEYIQKIIKDDNTFGSRDLENSISVPTFDKIFKLKNPSPLGANSVAEGLSMFLNVNAEKAKELYSQFPETLRATYRDKALKIAKERITGRHTGKFWKDLGLEEGTTDFNNYFKILFLWGFCWHLIYGGERGIYRKVDRSLLMDSFNKVDYIIRRFDWEELFNATLNIKAWKIDENFNRYFDYDPIQAFEVLKFALEDYDDDYDDDDLSYIAAAKILQTQVANTMGANVNIFNSYHEKRKNLSDWYIEPDGSLSPNNDEDATAEVVSPPLSVQDAVTSLKNFYSLASQLKLYTNQSTGLHINVSIPQKIDVLKLAVFLGDQYVLKYFGRENSDYAVSAEKSINQQIDPTELSKKTKDPLHTKMLQKIAQDSTSSHTASISNNGKYISFRHAGGDYLTNYQGVFGIVGRFVRAMLIASDPTAYAQEYKTKLAKLIGTRSTPTADADSGVIQHIRTKGTPELTIMFGVIRGKDINKMLNNILLKTFNRANGFVITSITPGGPAVKNAILATTQSSWAKEVIAKADDQRFFTANILPATTKSVQEIENLFGKASVTYRTLNDNLDTQSYFIYSTGVIPPNDPRTQGLIKSLLKQRYAK